MIRFRRLLLGLVAPFVLLALIGAACVPAFDPVEELPDGVVAFLATPGDGFTTYRVDTTQPATRLLLSFYGSDLSENAAECTGGGEQVDCVVGPFESFYQVSIGGNVEIAAGDLVGILCLANDGGEECFEIRMVS